MVWVVSPFFFSDLRPSRVICLTNMVSFGGIDEDFVEEVKEECLNYGDIIVGV